VVHTLLQMDTFHSENQQPRQAVVTDAVLVTALGGDIDTLWRRLMQKGTAIGPISRFPVDQEHYTAGIAAIIDDLKPSRDHSLIKSLLDRLMVQMGPVPSDATLITATLKAGIDNLEAVCRGNPSGFQDIPLSSLAEHISPQIGLKSNGLCISASCASSTIAVAQGAALIESGQAEAVLVCCAEIVSEYAFAGFSSLKALAPAPCQPFDRGRRGLSLGEGAAALLLMPAARAGREGRDRLGTICGWGITNDAAHITAPAKGGHGLAQAIDKALKSAEKKPEEITAICAHGTGTIYNDRMELDAFKHILGPRKRPIFSVKGAIGHTLGAAGGIEIILGLKALATLTIPPTIGFTHPEKGAEGQVSAETQAIANGCLLTTNSGFGGVNAAIILGP